MSVEMALKQFIEANVDRGSTLVLGVSGGRDSMAMLAATIAVCRGVATKWSHRIVVVHVHHGLRMNADRDAVFVTDYCEENGISSCVTRVNVDKTSGEGIESAARAARYQAFMDTAKQYPQPVLVLAHHQEDQVETFLLRWLRGTGIGGLAAMRPMSMYRGIPVLRPLLSTPRRVVESFVKEHQVPYVDDETNKDDRYRRNYLRHSVLPMLREVQPNLGAVTTRLTDQLYTDDDYLEQVARKLFDDIVISRSNDYVGIHLPSFRSAHRSLQRRVIHILLSCFASKGWEYQHIEAILGLAGNDSAPSASSSLRQGLSAWRSYEILYIGYDKVFSEEHEHRCWSLADQSYQHIQVGTMVWRFRRLRVRDIATSSYRRRGPWRIHLQDVETLSIQTGCPTDVRVRPLGLGGSKKLQDVFTDCKIPRRFRRQWPIVSVRGDIVWIPGLMRCEGYAVGPNVTDGWIIFGHLDSTTRQEMGTLSWDTGRIIRE